MRNVARQEYGRCIVGFEIMLLAAEEIAALPSLGVPQYRQHLLDIIEDDLRTVGGSHRVDQPLRADEDQDPQRADEDDRRPERYLSESVWSHKYDSGASVAETRRHRGGFRIRCGQAGRGLSRLGRGRHASLALEGIGPSGEVRWREGAAKVIALSYLAAQLGETFQILGPLHTFGDGFHSEAACQRD